MIRLLLAALPLLSMGCAAGTETKASRDRLNCEYNARYDAYGNARTTFDAATMLEACSR